MRKATLGVGAGLFWVVCLLPATLSEDNADWLGVLALTTTLGPIFFYTMLRGIEDIDAALYVRVCVRQMVGLAISTFVGIYLARNTTSSIEAIATILAIAGATFVAPVRGVAYAVRPLSAITAGLGGAVVGVFVGGLPFSLLTVVSSLIAGCALLPRARPGTPPPRLLRHFIVWSNGDASS